MAARFAILGAPVAEVDDTPLPGAPRPAPTSYAEALHEVHGSIEDTLLASDTPTMKVVKDDAPVAISGREETLVGGSAVAGVRREMPAKIGRYMVIAPLGEGGMGVVFAAYDPQLDRKVAIKLVRPAYTETSGGEAQARLVREAQALARLRHPNIVTVYEVGTFGDEVYVAMELVDGVTLRTWQFEHARSWRDIVRVYTAAGRGLAAAHRTGLVHRDFKPDSGLAV